MGKKQRKERTSLKAMQEAYTASRKEARQKHARARKRSRLAAYKRTCRSPVPYVNRDVDWAEEQVLGWIA